MKTKRLMALVLSVTTILTLGITVFAAKSTTATVPVTLTVSNEYRAVNVTVPASLPVYVINGTIVWQLPDRTVTSTKPVEAGV